MRRFLYILTLALTLLIPQEKGLAEKGNFAFKAVTDSIKSTLKTLKTDSARYDAYKNIGMHLNSEFPAISFKYFKTALFYAQRMKDMDKASFAMSLMANALTKTGDYGAAIDTLKSAIRLSRNSATDAHKIYYYSQLGKDYSILGRNEEAMTMFNKSNSIIQYSQILATLHRFKAEGKSISTHGEGEMFVDYLTMLLNFGEFLNTNGKTDSAKILLSHGLVISDLINDYAKQTITYFHLAQYAFGHKNYKEAISYLNKCNEVLRTKSPKTYQDFTFPEIYLMIGRCYYELGDFVNAKKALDAHGSALLDKDALLEYRILLSKILIKNGNTGDAYKLMEKIISQKDSLTNIALLDVYSVYKEYYRAKGDYKTSIDYALKMNYIRDSLFMDANVANVASKLLLLQYSQKEHELDLSRKNNSLANDKLKAEQLVQNIFIGLLICFIALLFVVIFNSRHHRRTLERLGIMNSELESVNGKLGETNATKDKFFSIIANDLRTPIGKTKESLLSLYDNYEKMSDGEKLTSLNNLKDLSFNTYLLLQNLLTWSRSQRGKIEFNPANTNLGMLVQNVITTESAAAGAKNITIENTIPDDSAFFGDPNMVMNIIKNIFKNAVKYTNHGGKIEIAPTKDKNRPGFISFFIRDNGVEMPPEKIAGLFKVNTDNTTPGTDGEKGTGLGLILTREFLDKNGGDIIVESEEGRGSRFIIYLPEEKQQEAEPTENSEETVENNGNQ